jgi:Amt family ammonium transporter
MNAILGFSELIRNKAFGDAVDKYAEYAGVIHQSGQTLLGLINDMLDLAKIEGGKLSLRESDIDLGHLVTDAVEQHEIQAAEAQVTLSFRLARGLPPLRGDDRALRQILANLISNGLKFTPEGGCVTAFAQNEPDGRVAFGVEDTGVGMTMEEQAHAFERFGRGRHDVTTAARGSGLGLAIVKGFAEAHDADVALESAPGAGTRVTVYLPKDRVLTAERKAIA